MIFLRRSAAGSLPWFYRRIRVQIVVQQLPPGCIVRMNGPHRSAVPHDRTALIRPSKDGALQIGHVRESSLLEAGSDSGRTISHRAINDYWGLKCQRVESRKRRGLRVNTMGTGQMTHGVLLGGPCIQQQGMRAGAVREAFGQRVCRNGGNPRIIRRDHTIDGRPGQLL